MGNKYYTPDGFNDQFPGICGFKRELESKLRNLFLLNGYEEIETPGVEYFDVYKEFVPEESLFKFTDSKGSLLCVHVRRSSLIRRISNISLQEEASVISSPTIWINNLDLF